MKNRTDLMTVAIILILIFSPPAQAQQKNDGESTRLIRKYTTEKKFLNPLIDHMPEHPAIPSPRDVLGYVAGAPKKLTYYADIIRYLEVLAEKSDKAEIFSIGKTNCGRIMRIMVISSAETIENLQTYKQYAAALSDPRKTTESQALDIISRAKPIYYISCNLHSEETGSAEMSMELAYRLAASEKAYIQEILDKVIIILLPCLEPDGHDTVTDFYYKYRVDIDDERTRFPGPPYWGKYVFHDNNRDAAATQPLTRNALRMFLEWRPQLHLDLHEPFPILYISPGRGPFRKSVDPILIDEWHWMTFFEVTELTKFGMPGVWTHGFAASWYPGYLFEMSNLHNAIGRFYETFGNAGATTVKRTKKNTDVLYGALDFYSRQWFRPWPPMDEVLWSHRNNINYQESGVLSSLKNVARNKETILDNFWKKNKNAIAKGRSEAPYAWIIPAGQKRPGELAGLLNLLIRQGVEVRRLKQGLRVKEGAFYGGDYLVKMDQPYRIYALTMLGVQRFPEKFPPPYDDTGWTLGYMRGVETIRIEDPAVLKADAVLVKDVVRLKGKMEGDLPKFGYIIPHQGQNRLITARFALESMAIYAAEESFGAAGRVFPAGSFIIPNQGDRGKQRDLIRETAEEMGLIAYAADRDVDVRKHLLNLPKVALYHTWTYTQDSGWVRFAFDEFKIPYAYIAKDRVREGNLKRDYDVIVIPRQLDARSIVLGIDPGFGPIPYEKTEETSFLGLQDRSRDITGGMGLAGLLHLKQFVDKGGVLVLLDRSSRLATDFGLARYITTARTPGLVIPGSILKSEIVDVRSPIVYGYEKTVPLFHSFGILYTIPQEEQKHVVLRYAKENDICMSGVVKGEDQIGGKAALVDLPAGEGHVVMFNFNPIHRFQNPVDFMFVFNILLNFDDLSAAGGG